MSFKEFLRYLGYDIFNPGCSDIPFGFQDLDPHFFTLIGEALGLVLSDNMPLNVQNAIGNWFELLGQVILTYNAQQQYLQNGPGRFYSPIYKNVGNPFCPNGNQQASETSGFGEGSVNSSSSQTQNASSSSNDLDDLKCQIQCLTAEINNLKSEILKIKSNS